MNEYEDLHHPHGCILFIRLGSLNYMYCYVHNIIGLKSSFAIAGLPLLFRGQIIIPSIENSKVCTLWDLAGVRLKFS